MNLIWELVFLFAYSICFSHGQESTNISDLLPVFKMDRHTFNPMYMDYCDPRHCDSFHKPACGLNRATLRFKWFQSVCHIVWNNMCSTYRGLMKFDWIETKHCYRYVQHLRTTCPEECGDELDQICGLSIIDQHVAMFKNRCYYDMANCNVDLRNEYIKTSMYICAAQLKSVEDIKDAINSVSSLPSIKNLR